MIIEFAGPTASGKSSIVKILEKETLFSNIKVLKKRELILLNIIFIIKHPIFSFYTLYLITKNSNSFELFYYKFMNIFLHHNARYEKSIHIENAIIDEGFIQNLFGIFEEKLSVEAAKKYIKLIPHIDNIFLFKTNIKMIQDRSNTRGYFARETFMSKEKINIWIAIVLFNIDIVERVLLGSTMRFHIIDTNQSVEKIADEIQLKLR